MKFFTIITVGFFALSTVALHAEAEKIITFKELPSVVQKSVLSYSKKANIKKITYIDDEGLPKYEIETRHNNIGLDLSFAPNGAVLEIEKTVLSSALPARAITEIQKDYPGIKMQTIESVQEFYYDIEGVVGGKRVQFKVLATGDIEDEPSDNQKE